MATIPQMIKRIKPADITTDLDSAMRFCIENDISYGKMQQAETVVLLKEEEKARERIHERERLLNS